MSQDHPALSLPIPVVILDVNKRICFWNQGASLLFGYSKDELVNLPANVLIPDDEMYTMNWEQILIRGEEIQSFETYIRNKSGRKIPVLFSASALYSETKIQHLICTFQEISQYKILENRMEEREQNYRLILNALPDIVFKIDENGFFTFINEAVSVLNYSPHELIGKHFKEIIHPLDFPLVNRETVLPHYQGHLTGEEKSPKLFDERRNFKRKTEDLEVRFIKKQNNLKSYQEKEILGSVVAWGEVSSSGLYENNEMFSGSVGIIHDITYRKKREGLFRKLFMAVEQSPAIIITTDSEGTIDYINPHFFHILDINPNEIIGEDLSFFFSRSLVQSDYNNLLKTVVSGSEWNEEIQFEKNDGSICWLSIRISPILSPKGSISNFVLIGEEITRRKNDEEMLLEAKENAERASNAKSEFLANMSHELRTPLNGIMGFTEILLNQSTDIESTEMLKIVQNSGKKLLYLINDILEIGRIESGRLKLSLKSFHLKTMITEMVAAIDRIRENKGVKFHLELQEPLPEYILGDPIRVEEILQNLLSNAIKFTDEGSISLTVKEAGQDKKKKIISFSVVDTGIGIEEKKMSDIFELFTQGEEYITKKHGGTGLGLTIAQRLTEMMQGSIRVESAQGSGSSFTVLIPFITLD